MSQQKFELYFKNFKRKSFPLSAFASHNFPTDSIFWVEGSLEFIQRICKFIPYPSQCILVYPDKRRSQRCRLPRGWGKMNWQKISHQSQGGITNLISCVGTPFAFVIPIISPSPLVRSLRHVLDPLVKGKVVDPPFSDPSILSTSDLLPAQQLKSLVMCPSVYSRTQMVMRMLTHKEIALAFDLPLSTIRLLEADQSLPLPDLSTCVPGKVGYAVASAVSQCAAAISQVLASALLQPVPTLLPLEHPGVLEPCLPSTTIYGPLEFSGHSTGADRSHLLSSPLTGPASQTLTRAMSQGAILDVFHSERRDVHAEGKALLVSTKTSLARDVPSNKVSVITPPPRSLPSICAVSPSLPSVPTSLHCSKFLPFSVFPVVKGFSLGYPPHIEAAMLKELNTKAPTTKEKLSFWVHSICHDYSAAASMGISITDYRTGGQPLPPQATSSKVAKADDAQVPTHCWDEKVMHHFSHLKEKDSARVAQALDVLRDKIFLPRFRLNVWRSFRRYAWIKINTATTTAARQDFHKDCTCARAILLRVLGGWLDANNCLNSGCSWW